MSCFRFFTVCCFFLLFLQCCATDDRNHGATSVHMVDSMPALLRILNTLQPGDEVVLKDGQYKLNKGWAVNIQTRNVTLRSASGNRESVVIQGRGMFADRHHGIFVNADNVVIQDITIENVRNHCIQLAPEKNGLKVINCILRNAGEQILKGAGRQGGVPSKDCSVTGSWLEYSNKLGPRWYIGGIDVHNGDGWVIKNNRFRNIRSPGITIAEHAIHFWSGSKDTVVKNNIIENCDRGIGFGMGLKGHFGGIIQGNTILQDSHGIFNDVGIILESSPDTQVIANTIRMQSSYPNSIEYRFPATKGVLISKNIVNKSIKGRDGAEATITNNKIIMDE